MSGGSDGDRPALVARWKLLTEVELPRRAREERWRLRLDHCFKRVCLDWACGGCWYQHIRRPAERYAEELLLRRALQCAEEMLAGGADLVRERDLASLRWRGKRTAYEVRDAHESATQRRAEDEREER